MDIVKEQLHEIAAEHKIKLSDDCMDDIIGVFSVVSEQRDQSVKCIKVESDKLEKIKSYLHEFISDHYRAEVFNTHQRNGLEVLHGILGEFFS